VAAVLLRAVELTGVVVDVWDTDVGVQRTVVVLVDAIKVLLPEV
jgi:hypothetical protein